MFSKMFSHDFMVLNEKGLSFEERIDQGGICQVRPPKVKFGRRTWKGFGSAFGLRKSCLNEPRFGRRTCMSLGGTLGRRRSSTRPPIKGPQIGNGRVFSPFSSSGEFLSSLGRFHIFLHLLHVFMRSMVILKSFKAWIEVLGAWSFWSLDSPHLRV